MIHRNRHYVIRMRIIMSSEHQPTEDTPSFLSNMVAVLRQCRDVSYGPEDNHVQTNFDTNTYPKCVPYRLNTDAQCNSSAMPPWAGAMCRTSENIQSQLQAQNERWKTVEAQMLTKIRE